MNLPGQAPACSICASSILLMNPESAAHLCAHVKGCTDATCPCRDYQSRCSDLAINFPLVTRAPAYESLGRKRRNAVSDMSWLQCTVQKGTFYWYCLPCMLAHKNKQSLPDACLRQKLKNHRSLHSLNNGTLKTGNLSRHQDNTAKTKQTINA